MNSIAAAIVSLNEKLQGAPFDFAFLGGSVLSLLVNDPTADAIRVTKDVDIIADVRTRKDFHREERELESRGFHHDTSEDAPICRWIADGIVVDVLPVREEVLGWKSKWFEDALKSATTIDIDGHAVKVISAPYFVALKLEAFEDRGKDDFICSTDFEDVICLFNGRPSIVDEILAEPTVGAGIAENFSRYVKSADLEDAIHTSDRSANSCRAVGNASPEDVRASRDSSHCKRRQIPTPPDATGRTTRNHPFPKISPTRDNP